MGSMRNGEGDTFFASFNTAGCFIKGFAHESSMSPYRQRPKRIWPGVIEDVPTEFAAYLKEPAFSPKDTTFCIWRRYTGESWQRGDIKFPAGSDPDGSQGLLSILDGEPKAYAVWATEYYGEPVKQAAVREIYEHKPLTKTLTKQLNPEVSSRNWLRTLKKSVIQLDSPP